jgi:DNA repair exonuclease SbcCD nuclease subunit
MKILHVADTHLGYSAYRKVTEEGINQREMDNYNAFKQFIDYAIKSKPDLVLHAGDLFDSVRPNNRAITFAIRQILRLSKQGIPIVIIDGNHEHPKLKETGHIFSIFDHIDNVHPIYNAKYETLTFTMNKESITIHALPQTSSKEEYKDNLDEISPDSSSDYNIFITHGSVKGIKEFTMNEFNELIIPSRYLNSDFNYIALGHYHKYTELSKNAYYAGSTEALTFADAGNQKGYIELELIDKKLRHNFIHLKNRKMVDSNPIKCKDLALDEIMGKIKGLITEIKPKDKVFRIKLEDIPSHIYRGIDFDEIKELSNEAIHYEIKADLTKDKNSISGENSKIDSIALEFEAFIKNQEIEEKETLLKLGIEYIEKIETRNRGK